MWEARDKQRTKKRKKNTNNHNNNNDRIGANPIDVSRVPVYEKRRRKNVFHIEE